MTNPPSHPPVEAPKAWAGFLLCWLIPGAGFVLCGRSARGLVHFILILLTFALGLALHSGVAWPVWSTKSEEFNLINNFTFIVQMGSGLPALASLFASLHPGSHTLQWLGGLVQHPYYELGSYFLIVAGAMNYFAIGNFYDRVLSVHPRFIEQESGRAEREEPAA